MSRTSNRATVTAAAAVMFAVSALLLWSPVAELCRPTRAPLALVPTRPHVAPGLLGGPPRPAEPPAPLDMLTVGIRTEVGEWADRLPLRRVEHFPTWTPSSSARDAVAATVGQRLGDPGLFANAWCGWDGICWTMADTQFLEVQGRRVAMVTAAGVRVDEIARPIDCHACAGYLGFFALSPRRGGAWRIDAAQLGVRSGEFGAPGLVRIAALGPSTPGWTVEEWGGGQGYREFSLRLFAVDGPSVRAVLSTDTGVEEPDSPFSCSIGGVTTTLRFDRSTTDEGFYRLTGDRATWRNDDGIERVVGRAPITLRYLNRIRSFRGIGVQAPHRPPKGEVPDCD